MANPFKIEFKLRQHTPLIHFQHEQNGATLRATEVKPKLDKFLIAKLDNETKKKYCKLSENGTLFLDYRLIFDNNQNCEIWNDKSNIEDFNWRNGQKILNKSLKTKRNGALDEEGFPCFFANMGEETSIKKMIYSENLQTGTIICLDEELKRKIASFLPSFFLKNNFGMRQSKGFGSFELVEFSYLKEGKKLEWKDATTNRNNLKYYFDIDLGAISNEEEVENGTLSIHLDYQRHKARFTSNELENFSRIYGSENYFLFKKGVFAEIDLFYRALRAGVNECFIEDGLYFKSLMFKFAQSRGHNWDKKNIKNKFFTTELRNQKLKHPKSEVLFFEQNENMDLYDYKDLLGFSTTEKWKIPYDTTIEKSHGVIQRMKSSITFKPIKLNKRYYRIYFFPEPIPNEFKKAKVKIERNSGTPKDFEMIIPDVKISEYLEFVFSTTNKIGYKSMIGRGEERETAIRLINYLNQVRNQLTP